MTAVAIVGGGVGGLAAAALLSARGYGVDVFERNAKAGGKLASQSRDGFTFDTGPSLLTMPYVFRRLFAEAGGDFDDAVNLVQLQEPFHHHFADGSAFSTAAGYGDTRHNVEQWAGAQAAEEWDAFMQRARRTWEVAERTFFAGPMESPVELMSRMRRPDDLFAIDPLHTLAGRSKRAFTDERLQQWANRYATYSGSSPWKSPATIGCIAHIEQQFGCWHIRGGLAELSNALVDLVRSSGGRVHTNVDVVAVKAEGGKVRGIRTADGEHHAASVVIANCDAEHLYADLLPNTHRLRRAKKAGRSTSGFALLAGVRGRTPGLGHHNVWYSAQQHEEFRQIAEEGVASEPTIYVCCSSVTDPQAAPAGFENWFVLVNTAAGATTDWDAYRNKLIERLNIADRVEFVEQITPADLASRYRAPGGAIYGSSSNGPRSAFLRAPNRGPVQGLYLAGGSSHPGGGLPLVATSGAIVARMVQEDATLQR